jgi:hypothetical protein
MAKLIKAVFVRDPERHRTVLLNAGEEPEPRLAALVTNPDAWEDGKPPTEATESKADGDAGNDSGQDDSADKEAAPVAAKKTAARKTAASNRSRGRDAAGEGTSGE